MARFLFVIDKDYESEFKASVVNPKGESVLLIENADLCPGGIMANRNDLDGLRKYCIGAGIMAEGDELEVEQFHGYRVTWEIDVEARNAREAAQQAFDLVREPDTSATVFNVYEHAGSGEPEYVDLSSEEALEPEAETDEAAPRTR